MESSNTNIKKPLLLMTLIFLAIGYFAYAIDRYAFSFLVPNIASALSIPLSISGLLGTIFLYGQLGASIPAGLFMDKYGYKYTLAIGISVATFGVFLTGIAPNTSAVVVARIITGIGEGFWNVAIVLTLASLFKGHKGAGVGLSQDFFGLGLFGGPFLGGLILSYFDLWRWVFYIFAMIGLLGALLVSFGISKKRIDEPQMERKKAGLRGAEKLKVFKNWKMYVPVVIFALYEVGFWSWTITVSTYLEKVLTFGPATAGFLAGADGLAIIALSWLSGYFGDKFGRRAGFMLGGVLQGIIGIIAYSTIPGFLGFLLLALGFGFFTIMIYITVFSYIADNFDLSVRGFVTGITFAVGLIFAGYMGFVMFHFVALYGWSNASIILIGGSSFAIAVIGGIFASGVNKSPEGKVLPGEEEPVSP